MKRKFRHRLLAYEQLESKAAPSSILMVVSGDSAGTQSIVAATGPIAADSSLAGDCRYKTEQILRFVAENTTGGERVNRPATPPTAAQCEAADEMMIRSPDEWDSLMVLGYYVDGTEL